MKTYTKPGLEILVNDFAASVPFYASLAELLEMYPVEAANNFRYWRGDQVDLAIRLRSIAARAWSRRRSRATTHQICFFTEFPQVVDAGYARAVALTATVLVTPAESLHSLGRYAVVFAAPDGLRIEVRHEVRRRADIEHVAPRFPPTSDTGVEGR